MSAEVISFLCGGVSDGARDMLWAGCLPLVHPTKTPFANELQESVLGGRFASLVSQFNHSSLHLPRIFNSFGLDRAELSWPDLEPIHPAVSLMGSGGGDERYSKKDRGAPVLESLCICEGDCMLLADGGCLSSCCLDA